MTKTLGRMHTVLVRNYVAEAALRRQKINKNASVRVIRTNVFLCYCKNIGIYGAKSGKIADFQAD